MEWNEIKAELSVLKRGYPVQAAQAVLADPALADKMLEELQRIVGEPEELEESMFHLHAMNLLAQLRDTRAFRPLLALGATDSERIDDVLGDHLTESFDRCIAAVCDDETLIQAFVQNPSHDEFARMVMVDALVKRVFEGDSSAEPLIAWLLEYGDSLAHRLEHAELDDDTASKETLILTNIAGALSELGGSTELATVRRWWDAGWLDPQVAGIDWYEKETATPWDERLNNFRRCNRGYIRDAISHMQSWYCFSDNFHDDNEKAAWLPTPKIFHDSTSEGTYFRDTEKIGRNDPCPCGSGKKFKKCCA